MGKAVFNSALHRTDETSSFSVASVISGTLSLSLLVSVFYLFATTRSQAEANTATPAATPRAQLTDKVAPPSLSPEASKTPPIAKSDPERQSHPKPVTNSQPENLVLAASKALNATFPKSDIEATQRARNTQKKRGIQAVLDERDKVTSQAAKNLLSLYIAQNGSRRMSPEETFKFADKNKAFPRRKQMLRQAETSLLLMRSSKQIETYFAETKPVSGQGKAALARAKLAAGKKDEAKALISDAWRNHNLASNVEIAILKEFKEYLTQEDHLARADLYLLNDSRWRGTRARRAKPVKRLLKQLNKENAQIVRARLAVYLKSRSAKKLYAKLPKNRLKDWSVVYHQVQLLRRSKKHAEAWALMEKVPPTKEAMVRPDGWWIERRVNAYEALNSGKPQIAYNIVSAHGPVTVNAKNEAEFMSGWIALRFLKKPEQALKHFENMTKSADGPRTRGQSHYWLGRTHKRLGNEAEAKAAYKISAKEFNTFYGQVARQTLDETQTSIPIDQPPIPTTEQADAFASNPAIRAMVLANRIGDIATTRAFIAHLRYHMREPANLAMLAELALQMGDTQMSLRVGKAAMLRGINLVKYAYPVGALPEYKPLREPLEPAFLYAIARQESEFNTLIQSGAGARGILQVMPITARHICRQYKIKCRISQLKKDPAYNTKIASAYIADRNSDFGGSYIMTMPGYNAGPGRVRGWVRRNGDPREPNIDPIDWIERLHIKETREYTKKVLANIQIYRARLGDSNNALQIWKDIMRARKGDRILSAPRLFAAQ